MATIQDVAKHAQVGVGTVSRVLSGKGYVKAETRQKIQASIEELNYTPNEMARNLFFQKSGIVAVIVPEVAHPFFAQFVNAAEMVLCEKGYQTMICNTYYEQNYEQRYLGEEWMKLYSEPIPFWISHSTKTFTCPLLRWTEIWGKAFPVSPSTIGQAAEWRQKN